MGNWTSQFVRYERLPTEPEVGELSFEKQRQIRELSKIITFNLLRSINFKYLDFYYWTNSSEVAYNTTYAEEALVLHLDYWLRSVWKEKFSERLSMSRSGVISEPIMKGLEAGFLYKAKIKNGMTVSKVSFELNEEHVLVHTRASPYSSPKLMAHYWWNGESYDKIYPSVG